MTRPIETNSRRATTSPGFDACERSKGTNQRYATSPADANVATRPGPKPPNHALNITAGKNVISGMRYPNSECSAAPAAAAEMAESTGTADRTKGERAVMTAASRKIGGKCRRRATPQ